MSSIKTTCPSCGRVCINPKAIKLMIFADKLGNVDAQKTFYAFVCPLCNGNIAKHADKEIVDSLVYRGGVRDFKLYTLREHPESPRKGPEVTEQDISNFADMLTREDRVVRLIQDII